MKEQRCFPAKEGASQVQVMGKQHGHRNNFTRKQIHQRKTAKGEQHGEYIRR